MLDESNQIFDVRQNRYDPVLVEKTAFTEEPQRYYRMLKGAMHSLNHPYGRTGTGRRKAKKK